MIFKKKKKKMIGKLIEIPEQWQLLFLQNHVIIEKYIAILNAQYSPHPNPIPYPLPQQLGLSSLQSDAVTGQRGWPRFSHSNCIIYYPCAAISNILENLSVRIPYFQVFFASNSKTNSVYRDGLVYEL